MKLSIESLYELGEKEKAELLKNVIPDNSGSSSLNADQWTIINRRLDMQDKYLAEILKRVQKIAGDEEPVIIEPFSEQNDKPEMPENTKRVSPAGEILDSWEEIEEAVKNGTYMQKYTVGSFFPVDLGGEGIIYMQIAAFNADTLAKDGGKAAITFIAKAPLKTRLRMNPELYRSASRKYTTGTGGIGGWGKSELRTYLQDDIFNLFPVKIRRFIKPVKKYSFSYDISGREVRNSETEDSIWIPSVQEVYGGVLEESLSEYYPGIFDSDKDRCKGFTWWLRSADSSSMFSTVNPDGTPGFSGVSNYWPVIIGFCI